MSVVVESRSTPLEVALDLAREGRCSEAIPILAAFAESREKASFSEAAAAMSYRGFCMAKERTDLKRAITLCERAIAMIPSDGRFHANLAGVYFEAGNRRKAVEALENGLARVPKHRDLLELRRSLGFRRPPVIGFLRRNHPVNRFLGKLRYSMLRERKA